MLTCVGILLSDGSLCLTSCVVGGAAAQLLVGGSHLGDDEPQLLSLRERPWRQESAAVGVPPWWDVLFDICTQEAVSEFYSMRL
jgi:hypothetical protein